VVMWMGLSGLTALVALSASFHHSHIGFLKGAALDFCITAVV
jgi:hypothetical protein